jgi:hypothetical protein
VNSKHLLWLLVIISAIALMGCEGETGPAGVAGVDGADGADGANGTSLAVCLDCHTDAPFLQIGLEYVQSGHKAGNYVDYAGGRGSCSRCHSKQGFMNFAAGIDAADIGEPSEIDCATCHIVHPTDEFVLRMDGPVPMIWDETYMLDFGDDSNLCANCHQSRRAEPNISDPGDTFEITSTHYGPHHGAQANVLEGVGFAEIAGSTAYPAPSSGSGHLSAGGDGVTCVDCHMDAYTEGVGGHTWWPSIDACTGCHQGAEDFDINGAQTENHEKLVALRDRLVALGVVEYVEEDEAYEPVVGTYPMVQAQAFFNWIGLEEDRSLGAHNPGYFEALLDNTLEALEAPTF